LVVELESELATIVGLDHFQPERQLGEDIVEKLDLGLSVEARIHPKHPDPDKAAARDRRIPGTDRVASRHRLDGHGRVISSQ
jgi:hypothetical protein